MSRPLFSTLRRFVSSAEPSAVPSPIPYEIPERYRNAFYLANASFYDSVHWFVHRAYERFFPRLLHQLQDRNPQIGEQQVRQAIDLFEQCNSVLDVRFPIVLDSGRKTLIRGFRAQHGQYSGFQPGLGGLRIKEDVTRDHMKGLSALASYKHACMGIGLSGACGAIKITKEAYSEGELKRIVEEYAECITQKGYCDGYTDIIEPDINTTKVEMSWIATILQDQDQSADDDPFVLGKPYEMGGIPNYEQSGAQAIFFALDYFLTHTQTFQMLGFKKSGLAQKTFIIQGLGKLGGHLAKFLLNSGAICVGFKEMGCYQYDPEGIDVESVLDYKSKNGTLKTHPDVKEMDNDDVLMQNCDILILAAERKTLICHVADKVKAKVIVEAANGAITPTAHRILTGRMKLVLPDLYVGSGYSIASYFEYLLEMKRLKKRTTKMIRPIYQKILESFVERSSKNQIVASSTIRKIVDFCDIEPDHFACGIDHVMVETARELQEIAAEYELDLDLRTAAYIKAISSIHNSILDDNKY